MRRARFSDLAEMLKKAVTAPVLVAVDGAGGAGKTVFAEALRESDPSVRVVHIDDFYKPSSERTSRGAEVGGDFDWRRLRRQVLEPLRSGRSARYERYDWPSDRLAESQTLEPEGIVVVEGAFVLRPELSSFYDFSIWVDSPRDVRLARGVARDGEEMRKRWVAEWMPEEDRYVDLHAPMDGADLVVDGTAPFGGDDGPSYVVLREPSHEQPVRSHR
jgi:uridine kinase